MSFDVKHEVDYSPWYGSMWSSSLDKIHLLQFNNNIWSGLHKHFQGLDRNHSFSCCIFHLFIQFQHLFWGSYFQYNNMFKGVILPLFYILHLKGIIFTFLISYFKAFTLILFFILYFKGITLVEIKLSNWCSNMRSWFLTLIQYFYGFLKTR